MKATCLALRTAAHARDYVAVDACFAAGLRAEDVLTALLPDVVRTLNAKLFEIALCSSPTGIDLDRLVLDIKALGIKGTSRERAAAMFLRTALMAKFRSDELRDDAEGSGGTVAVSLPKASTSNVVSLASWTRPNNRLMA